MIRFAVCASLVGFAAFGAAVDVPTADMIVAKLTEANDRRSAHTPRHMSLRHYRMENKRFGTRASMKVRMTFRDGQRQFEILEQSGPGPVRNKVFKRMLESESEANSESQRQETRISPRNYSFRLTGTETLEGRKCFVLEAEPKSKNKFLFRGKVWVDSEDWAVAKIEGAPAQNPSMWVRKATFVHRYGKFGDLWMALSNDSDSEVLVFGKTEIRIEYKDYQFGAVAAQANR